LEGLVPGVDAQPLACLGGALRLPDPEHDDDRCESEEGGDDVSQLDRDEVAADVLGDREGDAGHDGDGPGLAYAPSSVDEEHEEQRHEGGPRHAPSRADAEEHEDRQQRQQRHHRGEKTLPPTASRLG